MPSSKQRLEVWRGTRAKTSGGLRKSDLIKNKRGKIVSKKKSTQAANQNNLGDHLREKGKKISKGEMLHAKKKKASSAPAKVEPKAKPAPKAPAAKAPAASKPKAQAQPQPAQKAAAQKKAPKSKSVQKVKTKINPITGQVREPLEKRRDKVSVDNIRRRRKRGFKY